MIGEYTNIIMNSTNHSEMVSTNAVKTILSRTSEAFINSLSTYWSGMDSASKQTVGISAAGIYQLSNFITLMDGLSIKNK